MTVSDSCTQWVDEQFASSIVPTLVDYIRIPNKSAMFDPEWKQHGHMAAAVELFAGWARALLPDGAQLEVPDQILTLKTGSALAGKTFDFAELDIEAKFDAAINIRIFNGPTQVDASPDDAATMDLVITCTSAGSDCGPDDSARDNFRERVPSSGLQPFRLTEQAFGTLGAVSPTQIRSVGIRLSTRARNPDRSTAPAVPGRDDPLTRFRVFPSSATNRFQWARVRTQFTEVHVSNLAGAQPW